MVHDKLFPNCRGKFDLVLRKALALSDGIAQKGSDAPIDMDDAGMRLTLDVVALVSPPTICMTPLQYDWR